MSAESIAFAFLETFDTAAESFTGTRLIGLPAQQVNPPAINNFEAGVLLTELVSTMDTAGFTFQDQNGLLPMVGMELAHMVYLYACAISMAIVGKERYPGPWQ
jgi:hypothetical protein